MFFKILFINLFERKSERENTSGGMVEGQEVAGSPLSKEADAGLDPSTLRSMT